MKRKVLSTTVDRQQSRFKGVEGHKVLQAAACLVDPREWPADKEELAIYGKDHLATVTTLLLCWILMGATGRRRGGWSGQLPRL